ncbi:MAG: insulinase family protein, partial [Muribaculaceae bacterium]|nr:insulinase family protein [Muribaculaceae bacterium]
IAKAAEGVNDYMYQNNMALATALENDWHGFLGQFDSEQSREFFNLVYEKITDPELCYEDFEDIRESMIEDVGRESNLSRMLKRDSDRQLLAAMNRLMGTTLETPIAVPDSVDPLEFQREMYRNMSLDSIAAFFTNLYSRPQGSIYLVCGNVNPDSIAANFAASFSRLVPHSAPLPQRVTPLSLPSDTLSLRFNNENPSQTAFDYLFFGHYEPGLRNSLILKLMSNLLRNHIIGDLREKRALVYSPFVDLFYEGNPRGYFYYDINSSAENNNMPQVHQAIMEVLNHLRNDLPENDELEAIKRSCIIAKREALNPYSPAMWRTTLLSLLKNGEEIADFNEYETIINSITPDEIRQAFSALINPDLYVILYMSDSPLRTF